VRAGGGRAKTLGGGRIGPAAGRAVQRRRGCGREGEQRWRVAGGAGGGSGTVDAMHNARCSGSVDF
jgi:hypothetical protein